MPSGPSRTEAGGIVITNNATELFLCLPCTSE